jgi:hypothetical protein
LDISVPTMTWNGETALLPIRSDSTPWSDIVSLRESRGEEVFLRKMTKALKKNLLRLPKKTRQQWATESLTLEPWEELSAGDEALRDFWLCCQKQPHSDETIAAFQAWIESRTDDQKYSLWETWHLLSALILSGAQLADAIFWQVWNLGAEAFQQIRSELDAPDGAEGELDEFLIASVEVRWLALAVYPEIEEASQLPKQARKALSDWSEGFFPVIGNPDAEDLHRLPCIWRSLARTSLLCAELKENYFRKSDQKELRKLLTTTCRLAGSDGRLLISIDKLPWRFLHELGQQVATKKQSGLVDLLKTYASPKSTGQSKRNKKQNAPTGKPSHQLDECAWSVLRTDWTADADCCSVLHQDNSVQLNARTPTLDLLTDAWELEIEVNGETVPINGDWEATCWHTDSDGDYLELQQSLADEIVIDRQIFLSRKDHFLYFAEVVHVPDDAALTVRSTLPFAEGLNLAQDKYTREWQIKQKKKLAARLFPVAFDQEIVNKTDGRISASDTGITIERSSTGSQYLPMVIDWHPHHIAAPAEWRKLSITQTRTATPSFQAGGYRLRMAEQHLFMYRSMVKPYSPRAILGEHTLNESLIGKFDSEGDVLPLLVVEE